MTKEVQRWGDAAMYAAEPMQGNGPSVHLLTLTPDPLGAIAAACKMYKGEVVRSLSAVTDDERREYFQQVQRTKLQAPFEFVQFHFLIEGVSRALTHQMVRQRTAAYAQESLRFAVKEDLASEAALPPSLAGTTPFKEWVDSDEWVQASAEDENTQRMRGEWDRGIRNISEAYGKLIAMGMPAEDARGLLPHAVTTRLHYTTNLRALLDHAGNRLCTQAQFEWRLLWSRIVEAIRDYNPMMPVSRNAPDSLAGNLRWLGDQDGWQYELLANVFKPVCYLTGKCEFKANFDRHCAIRERVDWFEQHGIPSSEWGEESAVAESSGAAKDAPGRAIQPAEWLLNPNAAREK